MRAVAQRVASANVTVDGRIVGRIGSGLIAYIGFGREDDEASLAYVADKLLGLRVFPDTDGKMDLSVRDAAGSVLLVSQFTLYGDVRRGRRPAFDQAMEPIRAEQLYRYFVERVRATGIHTETGEYRTHMVVNALVDGPVTILIDSARLF